MSKIFYCICCEQIVGDSEELWIFEKKCDFCGSQYIRFATDEELKENDSFPIDDSLLEPSFEK